MPGKIKVKVLAGRNLPVMDRASDTTDAFVEIKFGSVTHKTDVCRKSLNPHWNSIEWYRFEVDESELQDEPLQLRLMDHDTYSANDAIGKVVISLAPLLARESNIVKGVTTPPTGAVMSGWIPVFDTMHGIRGELNVIVKVELFSDFNKYKTSSCGVQFFHCPTIPPGYKVSAIHGFVEELVVNDDPEYQWIDKIRTPRASNEARQVAFIKLSNQVQRLVGVKAAELGANAVVGYQQDFDLEGEAGVVARAIGTAVSITALPTPCQPIHLPLCTQQQLRKYLDILATDSESIPDLNIYFKNHQDQLQKLLTILNPKTPALLDEVENPDEDDTKSYQLSRQTSLKNYTGNLSIYQDDFTYASQKSLRHLSEDQTDLNKLLKRTDESDSDSTGPLQRIKSIKTNFFTKRFSNARRKSEKQDDQISIQSNSSDNSRISMHDIKKEFKKLKRLKKPKIHKTFANKEDEGVGMASILARSVIHAHTSLACIAETQDSEPSPNSTMRRASESEPTLNMSDEDKEMSKIIGANLDKYNIGQPKRKMSDIHSSLKDISIQIEDISTPARKLSESCPATPMVARSENLLKLPGQPGYYGSLSVSGESSEVYTSSEEDDESFEQKSEKSLETTSSIVQSMLNKNNNITLAIDKNVVNVENFSSESEDSKCSSEFNLEQSRLNDNGEDIKLSDSSTTVAFTNKSTQLEHTKKGNNRHSFKFCIPFTHKTVSRTVSAPSSPIEKTGFMYRCKNQFSKISKSNMIKSLSHYSLIHRKKKPVESNVGLSQTGSSSDVPSKTPSETVLGSPFLSYTDLLSLDKEAVAKFPKFVEMDNSKVTMYIGSEPVSRASISGPCSIYHGDYEHRPERHDKKEKCELKPTGLVHTAMETILMEKVQSLLVPTTPEPTHSKEQIFFDDINEKLGKVKAARKVVENARNNSIGTNESVPISTTSKQSSQNKFKNGSDSLIHTAMETILIDKVQSLLTPTTPDTNFGQDLFSDKNKQNITEQVCKSDSSCTMDSHNDKPKSLMQTAIKTMLIDKAQSLLPSNTEAYHIGSTNKTGMTRNISHNSLLHPAIETKLIDKAQSLLTSDVHSYEIGEKKAEFTPPLNNPGMTKNASHNSLLQTAMETMLIDKAQSLLPANAEAYQIEEKKADHTPPPNNPGMTKNASHNSLFHTAMETMLIDKVQYVLPSIELEAVFNENNTVENELKNADNLTMKTKEDNTKQSSLYDALQTISLDKVQSVVATVLPDLEISPQMNEVTASDVFTTKDKKLTRQDSIHSIHGTEDKLPKMSKEIDSNIVIPYKITANKPVLQHFHPILSGAPLETIPSLPEASFDQTESLDIEGVETACECQTECYSETNSASVCDNSHAACRIDRSERDRERTERERDRGSPRHSRHDSYGSREQAGSAQQLQNPNSMTTASTPMGIHRRSSDSDLSVTPKGGSFNTSGNAGSGGGAILRPSMNSNNLDMLEYPFLTMAEYPPGFIVHLGGTVCARSVKLVDAGGESAARAAWWAELRTELRAHARALRCNAVIAYSESAAICEDVCVLSASGTAAVINLDCDFTGESAALSLSENAVNEPSEPIESESDICSMAHVPYSPGTGPYRAELSTCGGCKKARVPAVLLATCAKPSKLPAYSKSITLSVVAARVRRAPPASEPAARDISDQLPFLEYELHKLLLAKLRMQGANALFSLNTQIAIGERCVMALATGIAVRLHVLPPSTPPRIKAIENDKDAIEIQKKLWESFTANKAANGWVDNGITQPEMPTNGTILPEIEGEEPPALDLCVDKDACVLELDEAEDVETARALAIRRPQMQIFTPGLKASSALPPYAYAQVLRARFIMSSHSSGVTVAAEKHIIKALDSVAYKLRRLQPYALVTPKIQLELPEDEIQLVFSGTAIQLSDNCESESGDTSLSHSNTDSTDSNSHSSATLNHGNGTGDMDDDIFVLDEDQLVKSTQSDVLDDRNIVVNGQIPTTVTLTSLSFVSGSKAARRICALRLLFVRETTAVRELGGLSGFLHTFTCEVLAIVRAYTAALGGNALTSYYITQLMLQDNAHKNQGQCLLSVGGDVVQIMY